MRWLNFTLPTVTVFVDDYVQGRLPDVSFLTGKPARSRVRHAANVGHVNPLWLALVLFGPIAWLMLALVYRKYGSELTGRLPIGDDEHRLLQRRIRESSKLLAASVALIAVGLLIVSFTPIDFGGLVVASVGLMLGLHGGWRRSKARALWPEVRLDASRRWVTLVGVHPNFVAACEAAEAGNRVRTS